MGRLGIGVFLLAIAAWGQTVSMRERLDVYAHSTIGASAMGSRAFFAGIQYWRESPPEWGQGADGYGRHFGYRYARHAVGETIRFGAAILLKEDPRYDRRPDASFWSRVGHAVGRTFVVPMEHGGEGFAFSRLAGAYGSAWIANAWYPSSRRAAGDVLLRGSYSIAAAAGSRVFREFWPDVKRKLFGR